MASADRNGRADGDRSSDEEVYDVLCRTRRRHVLQHLRGHGGRVSLASLVEAVAAREYDKPAEELSQTERRRIYVSLFQTHLPKLDRQGMVEWDREDNTVELGSDVRLEEYLPREAWTVAGWHRYYLLVTGVGAVVTLLAYANLWLFSAVDPTTTGAAVVTAAFCLAIAHGAVRRR